MAKEHYEVVRMEAYSGASVAQTQFEVQRYDVEGMEADQDQAFRFSNKGHYRVSHPLKSFLLQCQLLLLQGQTPAQPMAMF